MEQGFTLPLSSIKQIALRLIYVFIAVLATLYFIKESSSIIMLSAGFFGVVAIVMCWYIARYKYVYLSSSGIRGRGTIGFQLRKIAWSEQLTSKPASLNWLKGFMFTSNSSGESVFIPTAILQLDSFQAAVTSQSPQNHAFRRREL